MLDSMTILDKLQERGFTPEETEDGWFLLPLGSHMVRVCLEDHSITIHVLTKNEASVWNADFSGRAPSAIVMTALDLAIVDALTLRSLSPHGGS